MGNPITANRMLPGGAEWVIGADGQLTISGVIKREGALDDEASQLEALLAVHYQTAPETVSAVAVLAATPQTAAPQTITVGITDPDVPRTVTVKGNASGNAGNVVITGTNIADAVITDTIALSGASEVEGIKAFKTVTSVGLPVETHAGTDTVSVGFAKKIGLPHIVDNAGLLLVKLFDGSTDTGTLAVDADEVEKNLFAVNGTPNGAKLLDLYYLKG